MKKFKCFHRVTESQTHKDTQYTGEWNFFVPDFNILPYLLLSQMYNINVLLLDERVKLLKTDARHKNWCKTQKMSSNLRQKIFDTFFLITYKKSCTAAFWERLTIIPNFHQFPAIFLTIEKEKFSLEGGLFFVKINQQQYHLNHCGAVFYRLDFPFHFIKCVLISKNTCSIL